MLAPACSSSIAGASCSYTCGNSSSGTTPVVSRSLRARQRHAVVTRVLQRDASSNGASSSSSPASKAAAAIQHNVLRPGTLSNIDSGIADVAYWDLLSHPDIDESISRAKSASDAAVLRRKGHLKEQVRVFRCGSGVKCCSCVPQCTRPCVLLALAWHSTLLLCVALQDNLIEFMRRMHETHTCEEVMIKMERWVSVSVYDMPGSSSSSSRVAGGAAWCSRSQQRIPRRSGLCGMQSAVALLPGCMCGVCTPCVCTPSKAPA